MSELSDSSRAKNLEQQRKLAKDLLSTAKAGDASAIARLAASFPKGKSFKLADAQHVIAREVGFESWPKLVHQLEKAELETAVAAMHRGDADALRRVLQNSASVRKRINDPIGPFGSRPIHMASRNRAVLDVLLDFGADVNLRSDWENGPYTVLDSAPEEVARHLLMRGAKLTAHAAARLGWQDELKLLVETNPAVVRERGGDGQQPLHLAKTVAIVDFLLDRGAPIDERCIDHQSTPAQYALVDRPDVCRCLLERGATPDIFTAARLGDLSLAKRLVDSDPASVTARTFFGNYPLVPKMGIYAWTLGFLASPHETALNFAHRDVFDLLMRNSPPRVRFLDGAMRADEATARDAMRDDPNLPGSLNADENAFIAHAAFHARSAAAVLMLKLGFDPTSRGDEGGTVLHAACWVGDVALVDALLAKNVDVIDRDLKYRSPPLGWAALGSVMRCAKDGDYLAVIERLIDAGADIRAPGNGSGKSLIEMANGNPKVQQLLRTRGAG